MRDLYLLEHSVRDPEVRPLVEEAIRAFNGGAHRSALISIWVAVVADLTSKVRALAEGGDGKAISWVKSIDKSVEDNKVQEFLKIEGSILQKAKTVFDLISEREYVQLKRLYQDRNLCAHPGFSTDQDLFVPSPEAVRAHLVAAHDATFSRDAIAGKRRRDLLLAELKSPGWPNRLALPDYLEVRFFARAADSTKTNMMKLLIKSAMDLPKDVDSPARIASRACEAANTHRIREPQLFSDSLSSVLSRWEEVGQLHDSVLIRATGAFGHTEVFLEALPDTALTRAITCIAQASTEDLISNCFFVSGRPAIEELAETYDKHLLKSSPKQMAEILSQAENCSPYVDHVLDMIGDAKDFSDAARLMQLLTWLSPAMSVENVATLQQKIAGNAGDQIRPARDVENALISAFKQVDRRSPPLHAAWVELADYLKESTNVDRYYGNGIPYASFLEIVSTE